MNYKRLLGWFYVCLVYIYIIGETPVSIPANLFYTYCVHNFNFFSFLFTFKKMQNCEKMFYFYFSKKTKKKHTFKRFFIDAYWRKCDENWSVVCNYKVKSGYTRKKIWGNEFHFYFKTMFQRGNFGEIYHVFFCQGRARMENFLWCLCSQILSHWR